MHLKQLLTSAIVAFPALTLPVAKLRFAYGIPFNRNIGLRLQTLDRGTGEVTLHLPFRRGNCNAADTVHGGVILALAESVHGFAIAFGLLPKHSGVRIFTRRVELEYIKKGTSDLFVTCTIPPKTMADIATHLSEHGTAEVPLSSTVIDAAKTPIAELRAVYHIRGRHRPPAASPRAPRVADEAR